MATTKSAPPATPRLPLSRDRILRAAIGLADNAGIESVSMRRLGQELGVEAMSLYNHVANKDDLLTGIVDIVEEGIELPSPAAEWKPALRKLALSAHDALERHPWAAGLTLSVAGTRPARLRYMEAILRCLRQAGFSPEVTDLAYHALESHIAGYTLWSGQLTGVVDDLPKLAAAFLEEIGPDAHPYVAEHVHQHLRQREPHEEGAFAFGLDLILDGLERMLRQRGDGSPKG